MTSRRFLRGALTLTVVGGLLGGAAMADTSSVPLTLGVVNGSRTLQVTGADGAAATGPASLSFGPNRLSSPFGVVVTDLTYDRAGYDVSATLSNLYKLGADGTHDCAASVAATGFSVGFTDPTSRLAGVQAVAEPFLTFRDTDITEDLLGLGLVSSLSSTLSVTVESVAGLVQDSLDTTEILMNVTDGTAGDSFSAAAAHPSCGGGAGTPDSVVLQSGAPASPDLSGLTGSVFSGAAIDTVLTPTEAITGGLLPTGANVNGGHLWEATRSALAVVLADAGITLLDSELDTLTDAVVADLVAAASDLVLSLIGQTGVYTNLPSLQLSETAVANATTGLYHGVMTVTIVDRP